MLEIIGGILFVAISMMILVGGPKNFSQSATEMNITDFEKNKSLWIAILCPAIGIFIVLRVLLNWEALSEKQPVEFSLSLGIAAIIYGGYRWIKLFRTR